MEKLEKLGNVRGINYLTNADIATEVLRLTNQKGVDFVVNNVGVSSIPSDLQMLRKNGSIALVGFLEGFDADWTPGTLLALIAKAAKIQ